MDRCRKINVGCFHVCPAFRWRVPLSLALSWLGLSGLAFFDWIGRLALAGLVAGLVYLTIVSIPLVCAAVACVDHLAGLD